LIYNFDDYSLDVSRRELRRGADLVAVDPQVFDLLQYLICNRERVVSKDDLIAHVWNGRIVSDSTLTSRITTTRQAVGDSGDQQRLIRTIARKGIRFVGDVRENRSSAAASAAKPAAPKHDAATPQSPDKAGPPLPNKPSIAVLAFANMSDDPEQEYFVDGIVEEIITELSRFEGLFVIARNSSFQWKGKPTDVREVGRDLGVRYVLEGSVRRDGERIRVSAQLIDAESGVHLWAEKYDHDYTGIFALQDTITESVVGAIEPEILVNEGRRAARNNPANLDAFDCCMRGMWHLHQLGARDNRQAEIWIRHSIELDPKLARAHIMLARVLVVRCWAGFSDDIERDVQAGQAAAERAVSIDDRDPGSHCALAVLSLITRQHERALTAAERAIELNPNFALGYFALGEIRLFAGQFSEMLDPMARCLRLSPRDPLVSFRVSLIALAHYHLGNYQEAVRYSERALQKSPMYVVMRTLAAALGQLGRTEEARAVLSEMERIKPTNAKGYWEFTNPYADPVHEAKLLEGLHKAGMPQN
jgi:TolB-like protein/tetratricopeptide (TPR) repeat protein